MQSKNYIGSFLNGIQQIAATIDQAAIDRSIELLYTAWERRNTVFTCGNGGSASTATHLAADLFKCTLVEGQPRLRALSLVDNIPLVSALVNDNGWDQVYLEQLKTLFRPGDVLLAISVHGGSGRDQAGQWSQNLLRAMQFARENAGYAIGFSGFDGGAMKQLADVCIVVPFETTPHVESFHVVLHHLVTFCLAERIRQTAQRRRAHAASRVS